MKGIEKILKESRANLDNWIGCYDLLSLFVLTSLTGFASPISIMECDPAGNPPIHIPWTFTTFVSKDRDSPPDFIRIFVLPTDSPVNMFCEL